MLKLHYNVWWDKEGGGILSDDDAMSIINESIWVFKLENTDRKRVIRLFVVGKSIEQQDNNGLVLVTKTIDYLIDC